jgi:hypothetical protein
MNQKLAATIVASALLLFGSAQAFAAAPADPNCLGSDISNFAKAAKPLGQNVVKPLSGGGFNDEILAHKQGIPTVSNCPDGGFPSHLA